VVVGQKRPQLAAGRRAQRSRAGGVVDLVLDDPLVLGSIKALWREQQERRANIDDKSSACAPKRVGAWILLLTLDLDAQCGERLRGSIDGGVGIDGI
jgi:hypothetical protein